MDYKSIITYLNNSEHNGALSEFSIALAQYHNSHLYEIIWGGVTRSLLRSAKIPVLMSN